MRNLVAFPHNCFKVFTDALGRKEAGPQKTAINAMLNVLRKRFAVYEIHYHGNDFENIAPVAKFKAAHGALTSFYGYDNVAVLFIRATLQSLQPREFSNTCQYCTLESIESMDHFLDQSHYPEFSLHAKNLLPCCSKCNSKKGARLFCATTGQRMFLNLYLDQLPNIRYLFCDLGTDAFGEISFSYRLKKHPRIDAAMWEIINSHYRNLELLERMQQSAITFLTEFQNTVRAFKAVPLSRKKITDAINEVIKANRAAYGVNYWKSAMQQAAIYSDDFWKSL